MNRIKDIAAWCIIVVAAAIVVTMFVAAAFHSGAWPFVAIFGVTAAFLWAWNHVDPIEA